jgi:hypothetical protein
METSLMSPKLVLCRGDDVGRVAESHGAVRPYEGPVTARRSLRNIRPNWPILLELDDDGIDRAFRDDRGGVSFTRRVGHQPRVAGNNPTFLAAARGYA